MLRVTRPLPPLPAIPMPSDTLRTATLGLSIFGCVCAVALPWVHLPVMGIMLGLQCGWALAVIFAFALAAVLTLRQAQSKATLVTVGLAGAIGMGIALFYARAIGQMIENIKADGDPGERFLGIGPYLTAVCGAGIGGSRKSSGSVEELHLDVDPPGVIGLFLVAILGLRVPRIAAFFISDATGRLVTQPAPAWLLAGELGVAAYYFTVVRGFFIL